MSENLISPADAIYWEGWEKSVQKYKPERKIRVSFVCPHCAKEMELMPCREKVRKYCSVSCAQKAMGIKRRESASGQTPPREAFPKGSS